MLKEEKNPVDRKFVTVLEVVVVVVVMLTAMTVRKHTYPNETDDHSEWHQNKIPNEKSNEPDDTKTPRYKLMISIRSCQ